jgi:hypothetical protein
MFVFSACLLRLAHGGGEVAPGGKASGAVPDEHQHVGSRRAAEIQVVLEGIRLPASRAELAEYAASFDLDAAAAIRRLPDRRYGSIDEVGEALVPREPRPSPERRLPRPERGSPPGREAYVTADVVSGGVQRSDSGTAGSDRD